MKGNADAPPASPSIYVIVDEMTAVFRKPLSNTRRPLFGAFSSRSSLPCGAVIALKSVAEMVLSLMLRRGEAPCQVSAKNMDAIAEPENARDLVRLPRAVIVHSESVASCRSSSWLAHVLSSARESRGRGLNVCGDPG